MVPSQNAGLRVLSFGECMLELQGTAFGALQQSDGGDTYNTAVYMARCGAHLGLRVDDATALGDDGLSQSALDANCDCSNSIAVCHCVALISD